MEIIESGEWDCPSRLGEMDSSSYSWELNCFDEGKLCSATIGWIPYFALPEQAQIRPRLPSLSQFVHKMTVPVQEKVLHTSPKVSA